MICPHCGVNLRYRERPGYTCSLCNREFALDPKTSPYRVHDARIRRLADKLRAGDDLRFTYQQLFYAAAKRDFETRIDEGWRLAFWGTPGAILFVTVVPGIPMAAGIGSGMEMGAGGALLRLLCVSVVLIAVSLIVNGLRRPWMIRNYRIEPSSSPEFFASEVSSRWLEVYGDDGYGGEVPGVVDERRASIEHSPNPRYIVLCPDRSVLVCLSWNAVARAHDLAFAQHPDDVPSGPPVLVLHDASPAGLALVDDARRRFGNRAVDVGIAPRTVLESEKMVSLREPTLSRAAADALPADLSFDEREWLAIGWWSPIAAVPPRRLIAAVERAVDRLDPEAAAARQIGFLTWPAS